MLLTPSAPGSLPDGPLRSEVVVALLPRAGAAAGDHLMLRTLLARLTGIDRAAITLSQLCPACGLAGHGPLAVELGGGAAADARLGGAHVSLSRADGVLALAVTAAGPVGIDLESVAALARWPVEPVLCSPAESAALAELPPGAAGSARAVLWTSKEAVLKAAGVGFRVDPRDLTVDPDRPHLAAWPGAPIPLQRVQLLTVPAPAGLVATVAVLCGSRPGLRLAAVSSAELS